MEACKAGKFYALVVLSLLILGCCGASNLVRESHPQQDALPATAASTDVSAHAESPAPPSAIEGSISANFTEPAEITCEGNGSDYCDGDELHYGAECVNGSWAYETTICDYGCGAGECSAPSCPGTCDDQNPCTHDYCSDETGYQCAHEPLSGEQEGCGGASGCSRQHCEAGECVDDSIANCCGNGECEQGENYQNCGGDCTDTRCGEGYELKCEDGRVCESDEDCAASNCEGGRCRKTSGGPGVYSDYEFYDRETTDRVEMYVTWLERPPENVGIYAAFTFGFEAGQGGYMGIQRDGSMEKDRAIFSIWSINDSSQTSECIYTDFEGDDLLNCGSGTTEGNFGQALGLYEWVPGREYRLRVERTGSDDAGQLWTGTIKDMETGVTKEIGTIHLQDVNGYSGYGDLTTRTAVFLEYYYGHSGYCDENNVFSKVKWRGPYIDGDLADRGYTWYPITCMYCRQYSPEKGIIIHEAGGKTAWNNEPEDFWD